ncbi:pentapeptide repeat-containing protein [Microcoleus sp. FACHB-672]|uniref:pentapeptide repeat-containing protein n=1 Tax=Microcoleus sp. FACHB-672 TaxID=2692825 RepID=UPI001F54D20A|nr:pentapeptide repeat-containing protein [Microcoleus sp. FACHB-672]
MQELLSSMPQPDCLSMNLTGIPRKTGSAGTEQIDLSVTLNFDESWQSVLEGRFKFGLLRGRLRLKLENCKMLQESQPEAGSDLVTLIDEPAEEKPNPCQCQVITGGGETEPSWIFAIPSSQAVLQGSLKNFHLGTLQVTSLPCQVQAIFDVLPADTQITEIEGLWPPEISPNKLSILEKKLTGAIVEFNLKPSLIRVAALQYTSLQEQSSWSSNGSEDSAIAPAELAEVIDKIVATQTNDFLELAKLAELNPAEDFAGANLLGVTLVGVDLSGANLVGANLRGALLNDADLCSANLSGANLAGADLSGALLSDANIMNADLHLCGLALANLSGANLAGANLREASLSNANLSGANLSGANLTDADLNHAGLVLTNFADVELAGANVEGARFRNDSGISRQMQETLQERGAIFEDL